MTATSVAISAQILCSHRISHSSSCCRKAVSRMQEQQQQQLQASEALAVRYRCACGRPLCVRQIAALPPGWKAKRAASNRWYFVDLETQRSTWTRPADYSQGDWVRYGFYWWDWEAADVIYHTWWSSDELGLSFYEHGSDWNRYMDSGRCYWSNSSLGIRFWEQ